MKRILFTFLCSFFAISLSAQITIVDVIPTSLNNETSNDTESYFTFNPANPNVLLISSFTVAVPMSTAGPFFLSTDGGANWSRADIIPTCAGCYNTGDITMAFTSSGALYAGILSNASPGMHILQTTDPTLSTVMTDLYSQAGRDQPYTYDRTVFGWFDPDFERVYVANNSSGTASAKIDQSPDARGASPTFSTISVDGAPSLHDNYQVRPVVHPNGTVYGAFIRRTAFTANGYNADIVVIRDDNWATTAPRYQALGAGGHTITNVEITDDFSGTFGNERIGGDLFLTVDPVDSQRVYISYASRTATDSMTLHLRRSTDGGTTWDPDLLTVPSAKNGAIAVNSRGRIAYLYQEQVTVMGINRWRTHLRRSDDGVIWSNVTLSDFDRSGYPDGCRCPYIGDYEMMRAIGKNFAGVFTAANDPATFPSGITYLRNHSPAMPPVLWKDDNTPVGFSFDPIFFRTTEMAPDVDIYVRDWTDNATVRDHGLEPSARNVFYDTSDVWNRRSNDPQPFNANDQPQQEDPHPAAFGHNFAFTRLSREATGSNPKVTIEFLYSDGGVGTNYVSAGTTMLSIPGGSLDATLAVGNGLQWDLPSGASNHVCLATQITAPGDPYLGMTLAGRSPGWPNTDLEILNDNNKAQRNMQVFMGMSGMQRKDMAMMAVAHNADTRTRDMQIGIDFKEDLASLLRPKIRFVGGADTTDFVDLRPHSTYTLKNMRPGENRWVEITADATGDAKDDQAIDVYELRDGRPINGYAFVFRSVPASSVIRENLMQHAAVVARLAAVGQRNAKAELERARAMIGRKEIPPDAYMSYIISSFKNLGKRGMAFTDKDPFDLAKAVDTLRATTDLGAFATQHLSLLNRLDTVVSMTQKQRGDIADAAQVVRWQRELFGSGKYANKDLVAISDRFLAKRSDYAAAMQQMLPSLRAASAGFADGELSRRYETLTKAKDAQALEGAHRDFLLRVEELEARR
jgi:hypothetical protein